MQKIQKTIFINAPKEKLWNIMLEDATYREWSAEFHAGSYYKGEWKEGTEIEFLGPAEDGKADGGILMRVKEIRPYDFVSLESITDIVDGKASPAGSQWAGSLENYTFIEHDGGTELLIDTAAPEDYATMMSDLWDKALVKLKEIAEK